MHFNGYAFCKSYQIIVLARHCHFPKCVELRSIEQMAQNAMHMYAWNLEVYNTCVNAN